MLISGITLICGNTMTSVTVMPLLCVRTVWLLTLMMQSCWAKPSQLRSKCYKKGSLIWRNYCWFYMRHIEEKWHAGQSPRFDIVLATSCSNYHLWKSRWYLKEIMGGHKLFDSEFLCWGNNVEYCLAFQREWFKQWFGLECPFSTIHLIYIYHLTLLIKRGVIN